MKLFLVTLIAMSSSMVFAKPLPKLNLAEKFESGSYNLYEEGCLGVKITLPENAKLSVAALADAKCQARPFRNGTILIETQMEVDSSDACVVKVEDQKLGTVLIELSCTGT